MSHRLSSKYELVGGAQSRLGCLSSDSPKRKKRLVFVSAISKKNKRHLNAHIDEFRYLIHYARPWVEEKATSELHGNSCARVFPTSTGKETVAVSGSSNRIRG